MKYSWIATYEDGTELVCTGENLFKDIDMSRLVKFGWYGDKKFVLSVKPGEKLIAFRRHEASIKSDVVTSYGLGIEGRFLLLIDSSGNVEVK